jgi:hypothetical protein
VGVCGVCAKAYVTSADSLCTGHRLEFQVEPARRVCQLRGARGGRPWDGAPEDAVTPRRRALGQILQVLRVPRNLGRRQPRARERRRTLNVGRNVGTLNSSK